MMFFSCFQTFLIVSHIEGLVTSAFFLVLTPELVLTGTALSDLFRQAPCISLGQVRPETAGRSLGMGRSQVRWHR